MPLKKNHMVLFGVLCLLLFISFGSGQDRGAKYLVITHDDFYNAVLPLTQWKHKKGITTKIVRLSEIGSSAPAIRDYIMNAYNTWPIRPEFLLLVGAPNYLPFPVIAMVHTDNYYTNMDDDIYNEILSGRLTCHNAAEAQTVVNKILMYERNPDITDPTWLKKGCLIAKTDGCPNPDDSIYFENIHYYANLMVNNNYVKVDTFSDIYGDDSTDVMNSVNNGRGYLLYRGVGGNNWSSPFRCNPDLANNGTKLPIVLSITCMTLGTGSTPATAEKWFLTGTPTEPRGAAGYFATSTGIMHGAHVRSAVAKGFADAVFIDKMKTFGEACENGRRRVYDLNDSLSEGEYLGFTTVGDPEMNLWITTPLLPLINHPPVVEPGLNNISISVQVDGDPVAGALVCAMQKNTVIYAVDTTDTNGIANLTFMVNYSDTIYMTVTGHTIYPYEGFMLVNKTGPYVCYLRNAIDDSIGGNNNRRVNPGETITLPVWVRNWGTDTAVYISGNLRAEDSYISMIDTITAYGSLCPGDSAISIPNFRFYIDTCSPGYRNVVFKLLCADSNDVWLSLFSVPVYAPIIVFVQDSIVGGNGNNLLEPGETVDLLIDLKNEGNEQAESLVTVLRSLSSYVIVIDSMSYYGDILPDSTGNNLSEPCIITASDSTPIGTIADFQLEIRSGVYVDTFLLSLIVGKKDYLVWNPDPTPSSGLNISGILSSLGFSGDYSTTLPANISMYRAVFVCTGVWPNNFVLLASDSKTTELIDYLIAGGRIYLEGGDVWFYDPRYLDGYDFSSLFGISAQEDGDHDMGPVAGIDGKFTQGMYFQYAGENYYMDHIRSVGNGGVLRDTDNNYQCGIIYSNINYRTLGTSFELGNLVDSAGVSTRAALLDSIMHFFQVPLAIEEHQAVDANTPSYQLAIYPNPFRENAVIRFQISMIPSENIQPSATLKIYDICGRCVKNFDLSKITLSKAVINWNGSDNTGRELSQGVYFVRLASGNQILVEKAVLLR